MKRRSSKMLESTNNIRQYCVSSDVLLGAMQENEWLKAKDIAEAISLPGVTPQRLGKQLTDLLENSKVKRKVVAAVVFWQKR